MKLISTVILMLILGLLSCAPSGYYQKDYAIVDGSWTHENVLEFKVEITDTQANYNSFLLIRHDDNYPTSNIWLKTSISAPNDTAMVYENRLELLMTDSDGKPLGKNFGDIWEQKKHLTTLPRFTAPGVYTIKIEQVMRSNPLEGIMNVGFQVEKIAN